MGLSTTYTKAETDFLLQQIDKKVVGGNSEILTVVSLEPPSGIPVDGQQWIQYEL